MSNNFFIHLNKADNSVFEGTSVNDVLLYTKSAGSKMYMGTSNTSNYISVTPTATVVGGDLVPSQNRDSDLGKTNLRFKDAWINNVNISSNTIIADANENLALKTLGTGQSTVESASRINLNAPSTILQGSMIPSVNRGSDLGTPNLHFKEAWIDTVHISSNTLFLGDTPVLGTDADTINIRADEGQGIHIKTTGDGQTKMTSSNGVIIKAEGSTNSSVIMDAVGTNAQVNITSDKGITMQAGSKVEVTTTEIGSIIDFKSTGAGGTVAFRATDQVTVTAPNMVVSSNMTVQGNLIVNGTEFIVDAQKVEVKDNIIMLNSGEVGSGVTASGGKSGITIDRGSDEDRYHLVFDEGLGTFGVGFGSLSNLQPIATRAYVDAAAPDNIDTSKITTGTLPVARGGTGTTSSTGSGSVVLSASPTLTGTLTLPGQRIRHNTQNWPSNYTMMVGGNGTQQYNNIEFTNTSLEYGRGFSWFTSNSSRYENLMHLQGAGALNPGSLRVAGDIVSLKHIQAESNIYATGNVGIGTTSPSERLHVVGNILATGGINSEICTVWNSQLLGFNTTNFPTGWQKIATLPFHASTGNGAKLYVDGVIGNWGGNDGQRFSMVVSTRFFENGYMHGTASGDMFSPTNTFELYRESNGSFSLYYYKGGFQSFDFTVKSSLNGGLIQPNNIIQTTTPTGTLVQEFTQNLKMVVNFSSGNVGIGTTAPSRNLTVAATGTILCYTPANVGGAGGKIEFGAFSSRLGIDRHIGEIKASLTTALENVDFGHIIFNMRTAAGSSTMEERLRVSNTGISVTGTISGNGSGLTGLTAAQIPNLDASKITTGTIGTGNIVRNTSPTFAGAITSGGDLSFSAAHGNGVRFWANDGYKIYMAESTNSTWGGRLDTNSDYNMYFRMTGGTNRGFVFQNGTTSRCQIRGNGDFYFTGTMNQGTVPWERLSNHVSITAGTGLSGGGILSASRTISLAAHSANLLTSGTVNAALIPGLDASKITSGTFNNPAFSGLRLTSGWLYTVANGGFQTSQGGYIGWNYNWGGGRTTFINNKGLGSGGWDFFSGETHRAIISDTGSYSTVSDDRLKSDEEFIVGATSTLKKLRPQVYNKWGTFLQAANSNDYKAKESGLIAQEIWYDAPELRHLVMLPLDADSNILYGSNITTSSNPAIDPEYIGWGSNPATVNYTGLIPYLIKAIQEKDTEIVSLQNDLIQANSNITSLDARLTAAGL